MDGKSGATNIDSIIIEGAEGVDINEFLCFKGTDDDKFFNREKTLKLLDLYKLYKKRLGTFEVRSMKKLWELVARDLSNEYRITIAPNKCENKFKVLERNYKKVVDNNNQSGRGRKIFEFEQEMDDIFMKKRNIKPLTILSSVSGTKSQESLIEKSVPELEEIPLDSHITEAGCFEENGSEAVRHNKTAKDVSLKRKRQRTKNSPAYEKRNDILSEIKNDLKIYYEKKAKRDEEKLKLEKNKLREREKRTKIAQEYLELIKQQDEDKSV